MNNHEAVKTGDLEKDSVVVPTVEPMVSVDCLDAADREGAKELTLRRDDEGGAAHCHRYHECGR